MIHQRDETDELVSSLRQRGFAVLPSVYPPAWTALAERELDRLYAACGGPSPTGGGRRELAAHDAFVTSVGLTFARLLKNAPSLAPAFLAPEVRRVLDRTLGDDFRIETTGATVSTPDRPMHGWHHHIHGADEEIAEGPGAAADADAILRLTLVIYLDGVDDAKGSLLLRPRKLDDPLDSPHPGREREPWPDQLALTCPPGSAVLLEARTWHAALPRRSPGWRRFFGAWIASARLPPTRNVDPHVAYYRRAVLGTHEP